MAKIGGPAKPSDSFKKGDRIFGKMQGWSPWPGRVLERCATKIEKYNVFFYGTHDAADLKPTMMYPYTAENIVKFGEVSKYSKVFKTAMDEIESDVDPTDDFLDYLRLETVVPDATQNCVDSDQGVKDLLLELDKRDVVSEPDENGVVSKPEADIVSEPEADIVSEPETDIVSEPREYNADDRSMLFEMQREPKESDADCVLRGHDGEILVHAALFRNWLAEDSKDVLPPKLELDLKIWTIAELAPIVILLYSVDPVVKLHAKARQAFKKIQHSLRKIGFNINIPQMRDSVEPLNPQLKFRCMKISHNNGRKHCYFVASTGTFIDACDECTFSGSVVDLKKHMQNMHRNTTGPSIGSTIKLPLPKKQEEARKFILLKSGANERQPSSSESQKTTKSPNHPVIVVSLHPQLAPPNVDKKKTVTFAPVITTPSDRRSSNLPKHSLTKEDTIIAEKKRKV